MCGPRHFQCSRGHQLDDIAINQLNHQLDDLAINQLDYQLDDQLYH